MLVSDTGVSGAETVNFPQSTTADDRQTGATTTPTTAHGGTCGYRARCTPAYIRVSPG